MDEILRTLHLDPNAVLGSPELTKIVKDFSKAYSEFQSKCTPQQCTMLGFTRGQNGKGSEESSSIGGVGRKKRKRNEDNEEVKGFLKHALEERLRETLQENFKQPSAEEMRKRISRMHAVVRKMRGARKFSENEYESIWCRSFTEFNQGSPSQPKALLLLEMAEKLQRDEELYQCCRRVILVAFAHDVESVLPILGDRCKRDWCASTTTKTLEQFYGSSADNLKRMMGRTSKYLTLFRECGPAALLMLGKNSASLWERDITLTETDTLISYIGTHLKQDWAQLNWVASKVLIQILLLVGWTVPRLVTSKTSIMGVINRLYGHIIFHEFASTQPEIQDDPTLIDTNSSPAILRSRIQPFGLSSENSTASQFYQFGYAPAMQPLGYIPDMQPTIPQSQMQPMVSQSQMQSTICIPSMQQADTDTTYTTNPTEICGLNPRGGWTHDAMASI